MTWLIEIGLADVLARVTQWTWSGLGMDDGLRPDAFNGCGAFGGCDAFAGCGAFDGGDAVDTNDKLTGVPRYLFTLHADRDRIQKHLTAWIIKYY